MPERFLKLRARRSGQTTVLLDVPIGPNEKATVTRDPEDEHSILVVVGNPREPLITEQQTITGGRVHKVAEGATAPLAADEVPLAAQEATTGPADAEPEPEPVVEETPKPKKSTAKKTRAKK